MDVWLCRVTDFVSQAMATEKHKIINRCKEDKMSGRSRANGIDATLFIVTTNVLFEGEQLIARVYFNKPRTREKESARMDMCEHVLEKREDEKVRVFV
jgi:hypothetical protein